METAKSGPIKMWKFLYNEITDKPHIPIRDYYQDFIKK